MKIGCWMGLLSCLLLGSALHAQEPPIADLIARAGNAEREQERYRLLEQLSKRPDLPPDLRSDLDRLLPVIDRWANGREKYWTPTETRRAAENGYLCGFFLDKARIDRDYPPGVGETSPLYPIWCMYRSRMLVVQENNNELFLFLSI